MNFRCHLGLHRFGPWRDHADVDPDGCPITTDRHQVRRCERCPKQASRFFPLR